MAYDEALAARVRAAMAGRDGLSERKMFGGLCFMLHGNMFAGVESGRVMLRVGAARFEAALARPGARPMDFTGRPMTGFVFVDASAVETDAGLCDWLQEALGYVETLPPKASTTPGRRKRTSPPLR
jgi:TfoX/Sxy family transcriptional regulator of competence genes